LLALATTFFGPVRWQWQALLGFALYGTAGTLLLRICFRPLALRLGAIPLAALLPYFFTVAIVVVIQIDYQSGFGHALSELAVVSDIVLMSIVDGPTLLLQLLYMIVFAVLSTWLWRRAGRQRFEAEREPPSGDSS